jgi:hypothetical protein
MRLVRACERIKAFWRERAASREEAHLPGSVTVQLRPALGGIIAERKSRSVTLQYRNPQLRTQLCQKS